MATVANDIVIERPGEVVFDCVEDETFSCKKVGKPADGKRGRVNRPYRTFHSEGILRAWENPSR